MDAWQDDAKPATPLPGGRPKPPPFGHKRSPSELNLKGFQSQTKLQATETLRRELNKLATTCRNDEARDKMQLEFDGFLKLFEQYIGMESSTVDWEKLRPLPEGTVRRYDELPASVDPEDREAVKQLLSKLVVIKLNGGLGTSMGCTGPKSVISVRSGMTFLDLTVQQIDTMNNLFGVDIPLILMNSFNTDADTRDVLSKYSGLNLRIHIFCQSQHPRLNKESLLPIAKSAADTIDYWYPPGHGDIYESFYNSGLLDEFVNAGKEYAFISNIDNLGATVDVNILNFLYSKPMTERPEFIMEVTDKTRADVKGGTLVNYDGKVRLLEIAQVPKDYEDEFKSIKKFKIFNTNNLWVSLPAMRRVVSENKLDMEIIVNPKAVQFDKGVTNVLQLERACGAAIKSFDHAMGINVPRRRFLPVKTSSDLMVVMSNLYTIRQGLLELNLKRMFESLPLVKLGKEFTQVKGFLARFENIPDMIELDHLTVSGDVTFGKNVSLRGTVIIIANHGDRIDIPSGAILENKIVSGNLRILNH